MALAATIGAGACTSQHRVPASAHVCADSCRTTQSSCLTACQQGTVRPDMLKGIETLEDVRESLCGKRCVESYEKCMLACPGVE